MVLFAKIDNRPVRPIIILVVFFAFAFSKVNAQISKAKSVRSTIRTKDKLSWIFSLGWNANDDDGKPFSKLFDGF